MALASTSKTSTLLADLPREILLDIYQHLDLSGIARLSAVNRDFRQVFEERKSSILLPVLVRDFEPFDEFLQIYTATADDIVVRKGIYKPRRILFKRFPGDDGLDLSPRPMARSGSAQEEAKSPFTQVGKSGKVNGASNPWSGTAILTERDLGPILKKLRIVQHWSELFPQMRWMYTPEDCRMLRPHESVRFRRAFYRWWLYGLYFHGQLPRPRDGLPEPDLEDVRISMLRYHSTAELLDLLDIVQTMKDVVVNYIYPRLNPQFYWSSTPSEGDRKVHMLWGFSSSTPRDRIIKTYAKLGPEDLLHYFENIYSYPKKRLITDVHLRMPNFTMDQESIHTAIMCALEERSPDLSSSVSDRLTVPGSEGGIVDFDDEREEEREKIRTDDGVPNGAASPMHARRYGYSPRGDDGSHHEEYLQQLEVERPTMITRRSSLTMVMP